MTIATPIELRQLGLAKESVRGTVPASVSAYIAAEASSELEFGTKLIADPALRGVNARYPSFAGAQVAKGTYKFPLRAQQIGYFLHMLLGNDTPVQQGATSAYKHTMTSGQYTQLPAYSFFINRGFTDANSHTVKAYPLGQVEKLKLHGKDDSPVEVEAALMAQQEESSAITWTPDYTTESGALMFNQTTVKVAGSAPTVPNVKTWSCDIVPGIVPYRPLSQQLYPSDFLAKGPFMASGDMEIYFMDEVERNKFVADTLTSLEFDIVGATIASTFKYELDLVFPNVEYEAFPWGDVDGFLGAKVKWKAVYQPTAGHVMQALLTNTITAY